MPECVAEHIPPHWTRKHIVTLRPRAVYDKAAARGGSDVIQRHGGKEWLPTFKATMTGLYPKERLDEDFRPILRSESEDAEAAQVLVAQDEVEDWKQELKDGSKLVTVRDVKNAVPNFKPVDPKHHLFARFVLPVESTAFADQKWIKDKQGEGGSNQGQDNKKEVEESKPEQTEEQKRFQYLLKEEIKTVKSFMNNDGHPFSTDLATVNEGYPLQQLESALSADDQSTPDSWIPRSSKLARLAGVHPLNAQVDTSELFDAGIITPTKYAYVRSHGSAPQLDWDTHTLSVFSDPPGLIAHGREWTMNEIAEGSFKILEIPVTFACDGNRRKEMNMIKKTVGVPFTAGAVFNSLWRGIHVKELLVASGLQNQPDSERWYLNFEGADDCSEGTYATSIPLAHAMDETNDVLLAFGMNGRVLHVDHGYPLRIIIPGYVGGRQVKWLRKLWVSKMPNNSYYHIWDNRVLPSFIESKDDPLSLIYHTDESTACSEQMLQSVICKPAHNQSYSIPTSASGTQSQYVTIEGFAYNGAGTFINRVEITLDGGKTWKYCFKRFVEKPLRYGEKYWSWIFWSCEVSWREILNAKEIAVRAIDAKFQAQVEHMIWNMTGMQNNAWYRVRLALIQDDTTKVWQVQFKHPVGLDIDESGWMELEAPLKEPTMPSSTENTYSIEEFEKHDSTHKNPWIILDNKVYDVTSVLDWHPGGRTAILEYAGRATTKATLKYKGIHDQKANTAREKCLVGSLTEEGIKQMKEDEIKEEQKLAKIKEQRKGDSILPDIYVSAKLIQKDPVGTSKDTRLYTFALPNREDGKPGKLDLPIGQHVYLAVHFKDRAAIRPYTPIYPILKSEDNGTFKLMIKTYLPGVDPKVPQGGLVSNYLDCMGINEEVDILGPMGDIIYLGPGKFAMKGEYNYQFTKINLVAGGTGITPHWQLIRAILENTSDKTVISMIYCNRTEDDILMLSDLEGYAGKYKDRFKIFHVLSSKEPEHHKEINYVKGRLDETIMRQHLYPVEKGVATLLCGSPSLIEGGAVPGLVKMGFKDDIVTLKEDTTIFRF